MQASRMFRMLYILLSRERVTAAELARELEVSVRTVYRDVQALCEAGVPLYAERGREGGLRILPSFKLNKSLLSEEERTSILAALTATAQSGAGEEAVLRKLSAFFGSPAPDWVQIDFANWSGRQDETIATLKTAILERRQLAFDYYAENGGKSERRACPVQLWFKGQSWYLRAYCLERRSMRTFKLSRLKRPRLLGGGFPEEALATRETVAPFQASEPPLQPVILRVDGCMAYRLWDDFDEEAILRLNGGDFLVRTAFPPGEWIFSLVLSYGEHAQVVAPQALRDEIESRLKKMLARYQT